MRRQSDRVIKRQSDRVGREILPRRQDDSGTRPPALRIDLATAKVIAIGIKRQIGVTRYCEEFHIAGSVRRGRPEVHDIDLVAVPLINQFWLDIGSWARKIAVLGERIAAGAKLISFTGEFDLGNRKVRCQVDINRASSDNVGMLLLAKTGSKEHNVWMASRAKRLGMKFCPTRGIERAGEIVASRTEQEVFEALGLQYVEPRLRECRGMRPEWQK